MAATIGAIGSLIGAGSGMLGGLFGGSSKAAKEKNDIDRASLANAMAQQQFANQLSSIGLQRSTSGYTDSQGNSYSYDPGTNSWKMTLGALPQQAQQAMYGASIQRNTQDMAQQALANEMAMRNAAQTQPLAEAARNALANFQPISGTQLGQMLGRQAQIGQQEAERPILSALASQGVRGNVATGPQMAELGKQQAESARDAQMQAVIQGMTQAGSVNQANLQALGSKYGALAQGGTPQLQALAIDKQTPGDTLSQLASQRALYAGNAPFAGGAAAVGAANAVTNAGSAAAGSVPPSAGANQIMGIGNQIGSLLQNKDVGSAINNWFGGSQPPVQQWWSPASGAGKVGGNTWYT